MAGQFGGTAGTAAIWWNTDVSASQWSSAPTPPMTSMSTDQVTTP